jgi:hypothetical protein
MGKNASELRREIAETRERMSETVDAISYKADVPARLRDVVTERVETVKETIENAMGVAGDVVRDTASGVDVHDGVQRAATFAERYPVGVTVASLVAGYLAGAIVRGAFGKR